MLGQLPNTAIRATQGAFDRQFYRYQIMEKNPAPLN